MLHRIPPAKEVKNLCFVVICLILQSCSFLHSHLRLFRELYRYLVAQSYQLCLIQLVVSLARVNGPAQKTLREIDQVEDFGGYPGFGTE